MEQCVVAAGVAALDHAVVAGGGDGAGNFQRGVQNGLDDGVVDAHLRYQTHHFAVGGDGTQILPDARVGATVDGEGALPVRGAPADDIGVHQLVVLVGGFQLQQLAQTLVFTGNGVGLTGDVLHLGDAFFQHLVFRVKSLVAEHIAVVFFRRVGQGGARGAEGGENALHDHAGKALVGNAAVDGQRCRQQRGHHQNDLHFGTEQISHKVSSITSGTVRQRVSYSRHTGSPITL